jgi:hypothetical protein
VTDLYARLEAFVAAHRSCGAIVGDADEPTPPGYRLWLRCSCGAGFEAWVTPTDAASDLVSSRMLAGEN